MNSLSHENEKTINMDKTNFQIDVPPPESSILIDKEEGEIGINFDWIVPFEDRINKEKIKVPELPFNENIFLEEDTVSFILEETDTNFIFHLECINANNTEEDIEVVKELNKQYQNRILEFRGCGSDRAAQTFHPRTRSTGSQKSMAQTKETSTQVSKYTFYQPQEENDDDKTISEKKIKTINQTLLTMEKIIIQNNIKEKQKIHRTHNNHKKDLPHMEQERSDFESDDKSNGFEMSQYIPQPRLESLWTQKCKLTKGMRINDMCSSLVNQDLMAVAYGNVDFGNKTGGLICLWTLKNISYPEKIMYTERSCTCVAISSRKPHLLAAGFFDGSVKVYDIRISGDKPIFDFIGNLAHRGPVWKVAWERHQQKQNGEQFNETIGMQHVYSTGGDGLVKQWSLKKGLCNENSDLMKVKRTSNAARFKGTPVQNTLRYSDAVCTSIDTCPHETSCYYVSTESGLIHKCSVSYNEQVLKTYYGHTRRIHQICVSPANPQYFMSCSEDWLVNIWHEDSETPIVKLETGICQVKDCSWFPFNSTIIACCLFDGSIQLWDLKKNRKDPLIHYQEKGVQFTSIEFAQNSTSIYAGDIDGCIHVYRIEDVKIFQESSQKTSSSKEAASKRLDETMTEAKNESRY